MKQIINGECISEMKKMKENSVDTIITDPPYGLEFMGKDWDKGVPGIPFWKEMLRVAKPGATLLSFGGTRTYHRMACAIEDAGWVIKDCIMYLYGSGFPKATDISKQLDKYKRREYVIAAKNLGILPKDAKRSFIDWTKEEHSPSDIYWEEFKRKIPKEDWGRIERKVLGIERKRTKQNWMPTSKDNNTYITKPVSHEAKLWNGWKSHGLKPAYEPVLWAFKPLTSDNELAILEEINNNLISTIWQSLVKLEKMDTSKLLATVSIHLNTVLLWQTILEELLKKENKSIISMESKTITELKILNSLLLKNTPKITDGKSPTSQNGIQKSRANGSEYLARIVESCLVKEKKSLKDIQKVIVQEIATYKQNKDGITAEIVEKDLLPIILNANSVLLNVLIDIIRGKGRKELWDFVLFVEKSLKQYNQDQQNTAMLNVWLRDFPKISPNYRPIIVAMKPNEGSYANNALKHGVSGLNIDGGRIGVDENDKNHRKIANKKVHTTTFANEGKARPDKVPEQDSQINPKGRFPANLILDEEAGKLLDEQSGERKGWQGQNHNEFNPYGGNALSESKTTREGFHQGFNDKGGASRFFYCAKASKSERNLGCEDRDPVKVSDGREKEADNAYQRGKTLRSNTHPTVKPIKLMEYLCLLTKTPMPNGGIVLDPFAGSGTTGIACKKTGRDFIGIEKEEEYCKIAKARINAQPKTLL